MWANVVRFSKCVFSFLSCAIWLGARPLRKSYIYIYNKRWMESAHWIMLKTMTRWILLFFILPVGFFCFFCQFILLMKKHSVLLKSANTYIKRASCQTHAILYTHMQFSKTIFDTCFNASNLHFRRIFTMNLRFKTNFGVKIIKSLVRKFIFLWYHFLTTFMRIMNLL